MITSNVIFRSLIALILIGLAGYCFVNFAKKEKFEQELAQLVDDLPIGMTLEKVESYLKKSSIKYYKQGKAETEWFSQDDIDADIYTQKSFHVQGPTLMLVKTLSVIVKVRFDTNLVIKQVAIKPVTSSI